MRSRLSAFATCSILSYFFFFSSHDPLFWIQRKKKRESDGTCTERATGSVGRFIFHRPDRVSSGRVSDTACDGRRLEDGDDDDEDDDDDDDVDGADHPSFVPIADKVEKALPAGHILVRLL